MTIAFDDNTLTRDNSELLLERIRARRARVAVIGLGYVGLPLVRAVTQVGFRTIGVDIDPQKIEWLKRGKPYLKHLNGDWLKSAVDSKRFIPTSDFAAIERADVVLICVPTPLTENREPSLLFIERTAKALVPHLRPGQLFILESTSWPGTTEEVLKPILEESGLRSGEDFFLAFSPEREDPGNQDFETSGIPKIVGGDGPRALELTRAFFDTFVVATHPVSSMATAEATKLTENIFRAVNIALVNELKVIFTRMGIDIWEVIDAAKTKPFGFMPFYPGPGLGGHCIPVDPFYLTWKAREYDVATKFIELAGEINVSMPHWVIERLGALLDMQCGISLSRAHILLLGLAYKKNVDDIRESPTLKLMALLEERGTKVSFHDPYVEEVPSTRQFKNLMHRRSVEFSADTIDRYSAVVVVTDHDCVDYRLLAKARLVVDTRNVCARKDVTGPNIYKA
jgi:UDP-N-acetyl-D-glucosamine dehydrogenase